MTYYCAGCGRKHAQPHGGDWQCGETADNIINRQAQEIERLREVLDEIAYANAECLYHARPCEAYKNKAKQALEIVTKM